MDKCPAQFFSFAVEFLVRTFGLEPADAFSDEVVGEEVLGDGALLESFWRTGCG